MTLVPGLGVEGGALAESEGWRDVGRIVEREIDDQRHSVENLKTFFCVTSSPVWETAWTVVSNYLNGFGF